MTWGLALSGGAACGYANGGVLNALTAHGLLPHSLTGSSMGAIIGALYAYGIPLPQIQALCQVEFTQIATLSETPLKQGLHSGLLRQQLEERLRPLIGDATLADCQIPFTCVAGRVRRPIEWLSIVQHGFAEHVKDAIEPYVFPQETRIMDAILASSAIPVVFSPVKIGTEEFIDLVHFGGIPSRTLRDSFHPDVIIGTDTNPRYGNIVRLLPPGWQEFLQAGYAELQESRQACDVLIIPDQPYGPHRFDQSAAFWEAGEKAAAAKLGEIQQAIHA